MIWLCIVKFLHLCMWKSTSADTNALYSLKYCIVLCQISTVRVVNPHQYTLTYLSEFPCTDSLMRYMIEKSLNSTVLMHVLSYENINLCEKPFFPRLTPFRSLWQTHASLAKNMVDKDIAAKKESMVKLPVKPPSKPALCSYPHKHTNNRNNSLVTG